MRALVGLCPGGFGLINALDAQPFKTIDRTLIQQLH
jgi:hypothetical protein